VKRQRILAVIATTYNEAEMGVRHALTANSPLPIYVWCAGDGPAPEGAAQFFPRATGASTHRGLRAVWPALSIVFWSGKFGFPGLKLAPFLTPPFRVVIGNEAGGFFSPRPVPLAKHFARRLRDGAVWVARRVKDESASLLYRAGERLRDVLMLFVSGLLLIASAIAQLTPPLARYAMSRADRGKPSPKNLAIPASGSATEIKMPVRLWPRRAIAAAETEFVVLRARGETADAAPLIELARRTNAFAVARQQASTGWRARVATKHPFRRLQPQEATEVFAPHSSLIVMRTAALREFGVPRALTAGAALLLLYWRAASANYASYVLGHDGNCSDEAAMALEDAEFVLRLWLSPALRALAPAEPDRRRGNIAFAHPESLSRRGKTRVLVVSPYLPFPLSHGGAVRIYNLCRELGSEIDFHLVCFREANDTVRYDELHRVFRAVHVVDIDEKTADPALPKQVAGYRSSAMAGLIRRLPSDLVQLEYTQMALYREQSAPRPAILVEHDITWTLYRQLGDAQATLWQSFETAALQQVDAVWTMSETDQQLASAAGARHSWLVPNGVDLQRFQPEPRISVPQTTTTPIILFVGSFRHLPNLLAFEALRVRIMPEVWKTFPDAKLHAIAGPQHERAASLAKKRGLLMPDSRIRIEGFVEDVRPAYRECTVVAVPIPVSAGTNIKVVEAMAAGRPVVSNATGCQGLGLADGEDLLVREIGIDFAEGIITLLGDERLREHIAAAARKTAERRFGWAAIAREGLACYRGLTERSRPPKLVDLT
jgi:glycosyltransferase involved in cell wall biosynthesis